MENQKKKLKKIVYSVAKNEVYKAEDLYNELDIMNKNIINNTDIRTMRLKIMDLKAYSNNQKYSKILKYKDNLECKFFLYNKLKGTFFQEQMH